MELKKYIGNVCVTIGVLCTLCAIGFAVYNWQTDKHAAKASADAAAQIFDALQDTGDASESDDIDDANLTQSAQSFVIIDEISYVGVIEIPQIGLSLPVQSTWSYEALKETPCVYEGSQSEGTLLIAAHNYQSHFGSLYQLQVGDELYLHMADGSVYTYCVSASEIIHEENPSALTAGEWDLTLFTCNTDNTERVVVRFVAVDEA